MKKNQSIVKGSSFASCAGCLIFETILKQQKKKEEEKFQDNDNNQTFIYGLGNICIFFFLLFFLISFSSFPFSFSHSISVHRTLFCLPLFHSPFHLATSHICLVLNSTATSLICINAHFRYLLIQRHLSWKKIESLIHILNVSR